MNDAEKRKLRLLVARRRLEAGQFADADAVFDMMDAQRERQWFGSAARAHAAVIAFEGDSR